MPSSRSSNCDEATQYLESRYLEVVVECEKWER